MRLKVASKKASGFILSLADSDGSWQEGKIYTRAQLTGAVLAFQHQGLAYRITQVVEVEYLASFPEKEGDEATE